MRLTFALLLTFLLLVAPAHAAGTVAVQNGVPTFTGDDGPNEVKFTGTTGGLLATVTVSDARGGVTAGNGCTGGGTEASCQSLLGFTGGVRAILAGGDDQVTVDLSDDAPSLLEGGAGNDLLVGGTGVDTMQGGDGDDTLDGRAGDDDYNGGEGNDVLRLLQGSDIADGGGGFDSADYSASDRPVSVTFGDGDANEGPQGEHDRISNTERAIGGAADDTLSGTEGTQWFEGADGNDTLEGAGGDDLLNGGNGDDTLNGGDGKDLIDGGPGTDAYDAGPGDDLINARDGVAETVHCGDGADIVAADDADIPDFCEIFARPDRDGDGVIDSQDQCPDEKANTATGCPAPPAPAPTPTPAPTGPTGPSGSVPGLNPLAPIGGGGPSERAYDAADAVLRGVRKALAKRKLGTLVRKGLRASIRVRSGDRVEVRITFRSGRALLAKGTLKRSGRITLKPTKKAAGYVAGKSSLRLELRVRYREGSTGGTVSRTARLRVKR